LAQNPTRAVSSSLNFHGSNNDKNSGGGLLTNENNKAYTESSVKITTEAEIE